MEGIDAEGRGQQTKTIVSRAKACATCFPDYARQRAIQRTCQHFWREHARSPESLQSGSKSCTCRAVLEFVTTLASCRRIRPVFSTLRAQQTGGAVMRLLENTRSGRTDIHSLRFAFRSPDHLARCLLRGAVFQQPLYPHRGAFCGLLAIKRKFKPLLAEVICPASANFQSLPASLSSQAGQIFRSFKSGYCAA